MKNIQSSKDILTSILSELKGAVNHCPSGTGKRDKLWLEDAEKVIQRHLPYTEGYIKPPCMIGDTLYDISDFLDGRNSPEITELHCKELTIVRFENGVPIWCIDSTEIYPEDINTRIFYSEQDAMKGIENQLQCLTPVITR